LPGGVNGIPHAEHEEAGLANTHRPGHAFHCNFSGVIFVFCVNDLAIIMIIAGKDSDNVSYCRDKPHRVFFAEDILILVSS
jgi:hypothetical protein